MLECIDGRSFGGFCWKEVPRRNGSRKEGILVRRRIATDSPKLKTVVGSGAEICCSKMSCGYCDDVQSTSWSVADSHVAVQE